MIILYINDEHCTNVEQLRGYFEKASYDSPLFYDLLDYARSGDMSSWLREKGEVVLGNQVDGINREFGDSEYFSRLSALMTGNETILDSLEKPEFSKCFQVEEVRQEETSEGMEVQVLLKVLSSVNETYEFCVRTSWGQKGDKVNPFQEKKDGILSVPLKFRKRPNVDFKVVELLADGSQVSSSIRLYSIKDISYNKSSNVLLVGDNIYKMIKVCGGPFYMGATEVQGCYASPYEKPCYYKKNNDFLMMESAVTQELWEAVMGTNPSVFKGRKRPVTNVSYNECIKFIETLNSYLKEKFRLPKEAEWEYAARGGQNAENTIFSGSNNIEEVAWYLDNSKHITHDVKQKRPNSLGIYDMSGNIWEWCATKFNMYNKSEKQPHKERTNWYINRGGCATSSEKGCRTTRRYCSAPDHKSCFLGFRLVK